ncbi:MAG TPA: hypothetical protein VG934_01380 [Candidatus Paceibacterota bacterium]|nr:hypothetical protein [Candidatus Paceibacterota bacterium]
MDHIKLHLVEKRGRDRATERGEMLRYFMLKLNAARVRDGWPPLTLPRMGRILQAIPTKDLYYLKSVCDNAKDFSKKFWWEVNPKKHTELEKKEEQTKKKPQPAKRRVARKHTKDEA